MGDIATPFARTSLWPWWVDVLSLRQRLRKSSDPFSIGDIGVDVNICACSQRNRRQAIKTEDWLRDEQHRG